MPGTLFVCATPIGNLGDITLRALETLKTADLIAAEDTRTTHKLLNHFDIKTPCTSYHKHNEKSKGNFLVGQLLEGKNIALVSDAGTPGISDPGSIVIAGALEAGINVVSVPGPSAVIAALVVSGLSIERFVFEGFLSRNSKQRKAVLITMVNEPRSLIFYEAPHRMEETLKALLETLGDRRMAIVRELTKKFEEVLRGTISEMIEMFKAGHETRGEYVLIVEGCPEAEQEERTDGWKYLSLVDHIKELMAEGQSKKEAVKLAAQLRKLPKRDVYNFVEKLDLDTEQMDLDTEQSLE